MLNHARVVSVSGFSFVLVVFVGSSPANTCACIIQIIIVNTWADRTAAKCINSDRSV